MQETSHPIFQLAGNGNIDGVEKLLKEGTPINSNDFYGRSLLIIATVKNHGELVKRLLTHNEIELHIQGYLTGTALTFALFSGQDNIAKSLLEKEKHFNNMEHPGALNWAVLNNKQDFLTLLKAKGANFDLPGLTGFKESPEWVWKPEPDARNIPLHREYTSVLQHTPLCLALLNKKLGLAEFLIDKCNANPNCAGENGDLPLQIAAEQNDEKMVELLLRRGADPELLKENKQKVDEKIPDYLKIRKPKINPNIIQMLEKSREQKMNPNSFVPTFFRTPPAVIPAKAKGVPEETIDQLKANAELWKRLTTNPDEWDNIQQVIKKEILKDSPRNNNAPVTVV